VMVVLQLALSLSESLLDLQIMHTGAPVAIVPTKDTWLLSPSGVGNLLTDTAKAKTKEVVNKATEEALDTVSDGIQNFVDAKVEDLTSYTDEYIASLQETLEAKAYELMDQAFATVEESIMTELNKLVTDEAYLNMAPADAVTAVFTKVRQTAADAVDDLGADESEVGAKIKESVSAGIDGVVDDMEQKAIELVAQYADKSPAEYISAVVNSLQEQLSNTVKEYIDTISGEVSEEAAKLIGTLGDEIKTLASEKTEEAKKAIIEKTNQFMDETVNSISDNLPDLGSLATNNKTVQGSSALSKVLSFGYGDYLRVFLFMGLCGENKDILKRTANLIESNINYPNQAAKSAAEGEEGEGFWTELFQKITWFFTKKGSDKKAEGEEKEPDKWELSKSYTYVQIDAEIDMQMFFLGSEFFQSIITTAYLEDGEEAPDLSLTNSTFRYHSVMGY